METQLTSKVYMCSGFTLSHRGSSLSHAHLWLYSPQSPDGMHILNSIIGHYNGGVDVEEHNLHGRIYNILHP